MTLSAYLRYIPNIQLITQDNIAVKFHDLIKNKVAIISMFYATCDKKCVPLGKHMKKCIDFIGNDIITQKNIVFIHITLDAMNDQVKELIQFRKNIEATNINSWTFVTGNYNELEILRYKLGMYEPDPEMDKIKSNHSGMSLIMNERLNKKCMCTPFENVINISRKIFSLCIPEAYSSTGYKIFSSINFNNFSKDFIDRIFTNIHTINQGRTLPFLPENIKILFRDKAIEANKNGFNYDPYKEYTQSDNSKPSKHKCCCCTKD